MNQQRFVDLLCALARDSVVAGIEQVLTAPPGRRPDPALIELSDWFKTSHARDRTMALAVARLAAHQAMLAVLDVVDGLVQVEDAGPKGHFELRFVNADGTVEIVSAPTLAPLHELVASTPFTLSNVR